MVVSISLVSIHNPPLESKAKAPIYFPGRFSGKEWGFRVLSFVQEKFQITNRIKKMHFFIAGFLIDYFCLTVNFMFRLS